MNILYITTVFPSCDKGSTIYTDLAVELQRNGYKTVVVAAEGNLMYKTRMSIERNLEVLRIKINNYYNVNFIRKGFASLTISKKMIDGIKKYLCNFSFDLILFESPPISIYSVVGWAMKRYKCPSYLMLKDIFPQNGADLGLYRQDGIVFKYFKRQENKLYKVATYIGCMSEGNIDYVLKHNVSINPNKVHYFPNTKKIHKIEEKPIQNNLRKKNNISESAVVFLLGGNMGKPQALDFLAEAIIRLKEEQKIFFIMVGRGSEKQRINEKLIEKGCNNYTIIDNLKRDEYENLVLECDVGLVLLDYRFTIPNYPSRILSYMEHSMPIISATDSVTDIVQTIKEANCGLSCMSNDIESFIKNIRRLTDDSDLRETLGNNGRAYAEKNFDVNKSVEILSRVLKENK